jgi:hypothetical protein
MAYAASLSWIWTCVFWIFMRFVSSLLAPFFFFCNWVKKFVMLDVSYYAKIQEETVLLRNIRASLSKNQTLEWETPPVFFLLLSYPSAAYPYPPLTPSSSCWWPRGAPSPPCEGDRGRTGQISPCGPPSSPLSIFFSICTVLTGTSRAFTSTRRSGHVRVYFCCSPEDWGALSSDFSPFSCSQVWCFLVLGEIFSGCGCSVGRGFGASSRFKPLLAIL